MLSTEQNLLLARTGPETAMGDLIRRYWVPALLSAALPGPDCDPVRVPLLGERLVAFRDSEGRVGLLDERCPHRTASLFYGRNEGCGLRCAYHGWKFDVEGNCTDMPNEPATSTMRKYLKARAYPTVERGGVVWAYMGPPELKPDFPSLEWVGLPDNHLIVTRQLLECNWFQGLEGGFDASHLSFLHKGDLLVEFDLPAKVEFIETASGFLMAYGREAGDRMDWSTDTMMMPFHKLIALPTLPQSSIWVPIDDHTTMLYCITYSPERPLTDAERAEYLAGGRIHALTDPATDRTLLNRDNDYGIDRDLQRSGKSFTGIYGVGLQDSAMQESMGPIADRTIEHLGSADIGIVKLRRYFLAAMEACRAGKPLPGQDAAAFGMRPVFTTAHSDAALEVVLQDQLSGDSE